MLLACGPSVQAGDSDPSATGGGSGVEASSSGEDPSDGEGGTHSGGESEAVCGDGIVDATEGCDDGNTVNADGCSERCEVSGTLRWTASLADGFGVGLTSRDGQAVAAVQQFEGLSPTIVVEGYDSEGDQTGSFVDPGGLADLDIARSPVELLPDRTVALAYPIVSAEGHRDFATLDFSQGIVGSFSDEQGRWSRTHGVATGGSAVMVLHSAAVDAGEQLVLDQFDAAANRVGSIPLQLDPQSHSPAFRGGVLRRDFPMSVFLTTRDDGTLELGTHLLSGSDVYSTPIGALAANARASAFSDGREMWIWTGAELVRTDAQDHPVDTQPRSFDGELLWADEFGLVVGTEGAVVLYDAGGTERLTATLPTDAPTPAKASFVRPDVSGAGVFVLVDQGVPVDVGESQTPVALHYLVR